MKMARKSLERAIEAITGSQSNEFIAADVREAAEDLGEITGEVTTEDILDSIFSKFCVGK